VLFAFLLLGFVVCSLDQVMFVDTPDSRLLEISTINNLGVGLKP
jgi:hypothetical protein